MGVTTNVTAVIALTSVPLQLPLLWWHHYPRCNGVRFCRWMGAIANLVLMLLPPLCSCLHQCHAGSVAFVAPVLMPTLRLHPRVAIISVAWMTSPMLCGRNRHHHAGAFANVAITRALVPSLHWRCCLSRWYQHLCIGGAFANVAITRALLPSLRWRCRLSCWHQHLCIGIIANIALAPLPSSRSHHTVVFVKNLALAVLLSSH
jgi:hypothetical protein